MTCSPLSYFMNDALNAEVAGVDFSGATDSYTALQGVFNQAVSGQLVYIGLGHIKLSRNVTVPTGVFYYLAATITGGSLTGGTQVSFGGGGGGGISPPAGDIGGTTGSPTVTSTHLTAQNLGSISGTVNVDPTTTRVATGVMSGNVNVTLNGTLTVGTAYSLTLYLIQDPTTGGHTITMPGNLEWGGAATAPTFFMAPGAPNAVYLETVDGGSNWAASLSQQLPTWPLSTALGGTGTNSPAPNVILAGGATGAPLQPVNSSGTSGYVLTDNGAGVLPSFQPAPGGGGLAIVGTTGLAGFTLGNSTPNIFTWTAPNDSGIHRVLLYGEILITTATEVGGAISVTFTDPGGTSHTNTLLSGNQTTGLKTMSFCSLLVAPNTAVTISQSTALSSGGPATLWLEMWGL